MSRTKRTILSYTKDYYGSPFMDTVDDTAAKHRKVKCKPRKLTPYIPKHMGMYQGSNKWQMEDVNPSKDGFRYRSRTGRGARQSMKNANRSLKKAVRQQVKKEIENHSKYD